MLSYQLQNQLFIGATVLKISDTDTVETLNELDIEKIHVQKTTRDKWECDQWLVNIEGQTFDYFTGMGHRKPARGAPERQKYFGGIGKSLSQERWDSEYMKPVKPDNVGILHSLVLDSDVLDYSFDNWCDMYGFDNDSRKSHKIYEQCIENAHRLKKCFDAASLQNLRNILQDY